MKVTALVFLFLATLGLAACDNPNNLENQAPKGLVGQTIEMKEITFANGSKLTPTSRQVMLNFVTSDRIEGKIDCNEVAANVTWSATTFELTNSTATEIFCGSPAPITWENGAYNYKLQGEEVLIEAQNGEFKAIFEFVN